MLKKPVYQCLICKIQMSNEVNLAIHIASLHYDKVRDCLSKYIKKVEG